MQGYMLLQPLCTYRYNVHTRTVSGFNMLIQPTTLISPNTIVLVTTCSEGSLIIRLFLSHRFCVFCCSQLEYWNWVGYVIEPCNTIFIYWLLVHTVSSDEEEEGGNGLFGSSRYYMKREKVEDEVVSSASDSDWWSSSLSLWAQAEKVRQGG